MWGVILILLIALVVRYVVAMLRRDGILSLLVFVFAVIASIVVVLNVG